METVEELLEKWGFPQFIETFAANEIDRESLEQLNMEFLKELVPQIGPRIKLWGKIKNLTALTDCNSSKEENGLLCPDEKGISSPSTISEISSIENSEIVIISDSNCYDSNKDTVDLETLCPVLYSQKATVGLPYVIAPAGVHSGSTVNNLLNTTEEGSIIKASYGEGKEFLRNKLVGLIIRNELRNNEKKSITSSRFVQLAKEIYDIFPHESPEIYYVPYVQRKDNLPKAASGKLYHHYIQIRRNYKRLGILPSSRRSLSSEFNANEFNNDDDYENEYVLWLRNNSEPFPKVQQYWLETHRIRQSMYKKMSIDDYIQAFPCLKLPLGYTLLIEDFNRLYPGNENKFFVQIRRFCKAVLKVAETKPNLYLKNCLEEYRKGSPLSVEDLSDADLLFLLSILPLLFTAVIPLKAKKKRWHPSKIEMKEGFIIHAQTVADLEVALSRRREKYEEYGLTIQPVPVLVGNYANIESCYVSVNEGILYKVETALKAVDLCFKLYFALDVEYPSEAILPWNVIQNLVYEISEKSTTLNQKHIEIRENGEQISENLEDNVSKLSKDSSVSNDYKVDLPALKEKQDDHNLNIDLFVSNLYNNPLIPRKTVQYIIQSVNSLFCNKDSILMLLKESILQLSISSNESKEENSQMIQSILQTLENSFTSFLTEHRSFSYFKSQGFFILPKQFIIGQKLVTKTQDGRVLLESQNAYEVVIPLKEVFKVFFEIPDGVFEKMCTFYNTALLNKHVLYNFIQGCHWKNKMQQFEGKIVFPLFLYFDEYETGNALGSHAGDNKLGAVYVSIASMPAEWLSKLKNIFLFALFYSKDRVHYGNRAIFQQLIEQLKPLECEGITVRIGNKEQVIYFKLALILGDNLGLHSVLGLTESFSATYRCRFCKMKKTETTTCCVENLSLLRDKDNYDVDCRVNDISATGIKENCVWHDLPDFHITENYSVDIMHDVFEGICHYGIRDLITSLIDDYKLFSLETLNLRIKSFNYSDAEKQNKPPLIKPEHLKKKLKMSASEMLCFSRYLGLIIGDYIPENLPIWEIWTTLRQIIDIITAPTIHEHEHKLLKVLIEEHNKAYIHFFKTLKPKHHHLTHYPNILKQSGPLVNFWSMRYEQRHRESKMTSNVSCNFKNMLVTLATKAQLRLRHEFLNRDMLSNTGLVSFKKTYDVSPETRELYFSEMPNADLVAVDWVEIKGTHYKSNMVITISCQDLPEFGMIKQIILHNKHEIYFIFKKLNFVCFSRHLHAFQIENPHKSTKYSCANINALHDFTPCVLVELSCNFYVAIRHAL